MTPILPDTSPTGAELLAEVDRLVHIAAGAPVARRTVQWVNGRAEIIRDRAALCLPPVGSAAWWSAPARIRVASLLTLSERWLVTDPERMVRERLKAMSADLSEARIWADVARRPSHSELERRRAELGPLARQVDQAAAEQWAASGGRKGAA